MYCTDTFIVLAAVYFAASLHSHIVVTSSVSCDKLCPCKHTSIQGCKAHVLGLLRFCSIWYLNLSCSLQLNNPGVQKSVHQALQEDPNFTNFIEDVQVSREAHSDNLLLVVHHCFVL